MNVDILAISLSVLYNYFLKIILFGLSK